MDNIHYQDSGGPNLRPLICLHGFMGTSDDFRFARSLEGQFRLIMIDLPGHGRSLCQDADLYRMERTALLIVSLVEQLHLDRPHVLGYSMGGRVALYLTVRHAACFERFVLESASPGLRTEKERAERIEHDERLANRLESEPLGRFLDDWFDQPLFASLAANREQLLRLKEQRLSNDRYGLAQSLRQLGTGRQPSLWDELSAIKSEMLLITGSQDYKFLKINREMAARCPNASWRVVKGAGHNVHMEYPEEFLALVQDFLVSLQG